MENNDLIVTALQILGSLLGVLVGAYIANVHQVKQSLRTDQRQQYAEYLAALNGVKNGQCTIEQRNAYTTASRIISLTASAGVLQAVHEMEEKALFDGVLNHKSPKERLCIEEEYERKILSAMRKDLKLSSKVPNSWHVFSLDVKQR